MIPKVSAGGCGIFAPHRTPSPRRSGRWPARLRGRRSEGRRVTPGHSREPGLRAQSAAQPRMLLSLPSTLSENQ